MLRARGELPVQEHGHAELLADERGSGESLGGRGAAPLLVEVDDRHHVEGAHVRVDAGVRADVDSGNRRAGEADEPFRDLTLPAGQREHRPVVIRIGVQVEEAGRPDRALDRGEGLEIPPLTHVRHSHQERRVSHRREG